MITLNCRYIVGSNSKAPTAEHVKSESVETEDVADSSAVDTIVDSPSGTEKEDFGCRLESECYCKKF